MRQRLLVIVVLCGLTIFSFPFRSAAGVDPAQTTQEQRTFLIARYQQALEVDPDYLPLHYFLGVALLIDNQDTQAITELSRAYPAYADSVEMHYNLGLAYSRIGDLDSSLLYFERAEELGALAQPELYPLANAYFNLALACLDAGNGEDADRLLTRVLAIDPQRHEVHRLRGDLFAHRGDTERALAEFGAYLQVHPDDPTIRDYVFSLHYNRALQFLDREEAAAARTDFELALSAAPGSPLALYYLGYLDYAAGDLGSAVERLTAAAAEAPESLIESIGGLLYNCAHTLLEQRKSTQALAAVQPLLAWPDAPLKALYLAGNIHLARHEFDLARRYYRRVLEHDTAHRGAIINLVAAEAGSVDELFEEGRELYRNGEFGAALTKLEAALAINPADARARNYARQARADLEEQAGSLFASAEAALHSGDAREAAVQLGKGLALQPDSASGKALEALIRTALVRETQTLLATGQQALAADDLDGADAAFARALALQPDNVAARDGASRIADRRRERAAAAVTLGREALAGGRLLEARDAFADVLLKQPGQSEAKAALAQVEAQIGAVVTRETQWGRRAMDAGRLAEAREHFASVLRLRDDDAVRAELAAIDQAALRQRDALLAAARKAVAAGDFKRGRNLFDQILSLAPGDTEAGRGAAELEAASAVAVQEKLTAAGLDMTAGNFRGALARYRQVLDIDPANREGLRGLETGRERLRERLMQMVASGSTLLGKGELGEAEAAFRQALEADPYQREALAGVKRIAQLKTVGIRPGDEQQFYLQGIEHYTHGRYEQAVTAWKQVLLLSPGHEKARMNIDKATRKLRQIEEHRGG